jgi:dienelactone hydrolase
MNHLVPKKESTNGFRLLDFSKDETLADAYQFVDGMFKGNKGIYGVGFSLGGNYLLKAASMPDKCKFKGIVTVG